MMASGVTVLLTALGAALFFTLLGAGLARWLRLGWAVGGSLNAVLGWGVFTAIALPLQMLIGFTQASTAIVAAVAVVGAAVSLWLGRKDEAAAHLPVWAYGLAAAVALIPLVALLPRHVADGVILGWTASDHAKVAMIDEMTRLGLPAGNPFFGWGGSRGVLSYYYLWHFSAAEVSILPGISGWEADAAMTGFTAYASLTLMMGLAGRLQALLDATRSTHGADGNGADRPVSGHAAIAWVAVLSLAGSLKPALSLILGPARLSPVLADYRDLETWLAQASWVPQHLASAACAVLAALLLIDLAQKPKVSGVLVLGALAAAAFGSSAWVGGVAFAAIAVGIGVIGLIREKGPQRVWFILAAGAAAVVALVLTSPLLKVELGSLGPRHGSAPIAVHPFEVIGRLAQPRAFRRMLDLPAYWLMLLPIDLPAIYPAAVVAFVAHLRAGRNRGVSPQVLGLGVLVVLSLTVSWLLVSTIGNNDLGWRAMLPAILVLTPMAAAGLARWIRIRAYAAAGAALALLAASLPERTAIGDLAGKPSDDASDFAEGPALWTAVRRYAGPDDRVGNNPLYLDDIAGYPVNMSWALLSNRPSCYSGWETARAYVDLPQKGITALNDQFVRVFAGTPAPDDVRQMAQIYGCRVVVVTDSDGAWTSDPFAAGPYYRLAEQSDDWKIYRVAAPPPR